MATQYHVAHSATVDGAGLVAGGPWGCALGQLDRALGPCMSGEGLETAALVEHAQALANAGELDPPAGLAGDRVYLFHGAADTIVSGDLSAAAADFYLSFGDSVDLTRVDDVPAVHGWPTLAAGAPCDTLGEQFINACGYDTAGAVLGTLLGELEAPANGELRAQAFDQRPYAATGLADEGYLFVPPACRDGGCALHVFFHGCRQSAGQIGTALIEQSGFLGWAASNDLVLLFPQVAASSMAPMNPLACWDWWGYGGEDYLARDGEQLAAVRAMVEALRSR